MDKNIVKVQWRAGWGVDTHILIDLNSIDVVIPTNQNRTELWISGKSLMVSETPDWFEKRLAVDYGAKLTPVKTFASFPSDITDKENAQDASALGKITPNKPVATSAKLTLPVKPVAKGGTNSGALG